MLALTKIPMSGWPDANASLHTSKNQTNTAAGHQTFRGGSPSEAFVVITPLRLATEVGGREFLSGEELAARIPLVIPGETAF